MPCASGSRSMHPSMHSGPSLHTVARLDAPVTVPWAWFLSAPALAFFTAIVASIVPAWRALAQSPSESVRYE